MTAIEKIEMLLNHLGSNPNRFAKEIGLTRGDSIYQILEGRNGISGKMSERILNRYPQISRTWLLAGEGEMLLNDSIAYEDIEAPGGEKAINQPNYFNQTPDDIMTPERFDEMLAIIRSQTETIRGQQKTMDALVENQKILYNKMPDFSKLGEIPSERAATV